MKNLRKLIRYFSSALSASFQRNQKSSEGQTTRACIFVEGGNPAPLAGWGQKRRAGGRKELASESGLREFP